MALDDAIGSPTGIQVHLRRGDATAQIAQVGASLRHLTIGGVDIVPPYPADQPTPSCSGAVLAPWPNRIRDGIWQDGDAERALAMLTARHIEAWRLGEVRPATEPDAEGAILTGEYKRA